MEPQRPTMTPALQEFLSCFAEALGSPDSLRLALEVASTGLMTSPRELGGILINLHEAGKISDLNVARRSLAKFLVLPSAKAATAPAATTPEVEESPEVDATPAAAAPKVKAPKVTKAPKVATAPTSVQVGGDISEVKPAALIIDGAEVETSNWRAVLVALAESGLDASKEFPATFFRDGPSTPRVMETQLKGGQWLYTNLSKSDRVKRIHALATTLAVPVSLKTEDGTLIPLGTPAA